jgi:hypothetical protein
MPSDITEPLADSEGKTALIVAPLRNDTMKIRKFPS